MANENKISFYRMPGESEFKIRNDIDDTTVFPVSKAEKMSEKERINEINWTETCETARNNCVIPTAEKMYKNLFCINIYENLEQQTFKLEYVSFDQFTFEKEKMNESSATIGTIPTIKAETRFNFKTARWSPHWDECPEQIYQEIEDIFFDFVKKLTGQDPRNRTQFKGIWLFTCTCYSPYEPNLWDLFKYGFNYEKDMPKGVKVLDDLKKIHFELTEEERKLFYSDYDEFMNLFCEGNLSCNKLEDFDFICDENFDDSDDEDDSENN